MPTECIQDSFDCGSIEGRAVVGAFDGGRITSDAGALLLGSNDKAIGLVGRLACCFQDGRDPDAVVDTVPAMLGQRICGSALGYEDVCDHDQLRHDPVFGVVAGTLTAKQTNCAPLAGKSALNRLEHAAKVGVDPYHKISHDPASIERLFVMLFTEANLAGSTSRNLHGDRHRNHWKSRRDFQMVA